MPPKILSYLVCFDLEEGDLPETVEIDKHTFEAWDRCNYFLKDIPLSLCIQDKEAVYCGKLEAKWRDAYLSNDDNIIVPTSSLKKLEKVKQ